jgi:hypothetical protein
VAGAEEESAGGHQDDDVMAVVHAVRDDAS